MRILLIFFGIITLIACKKDVSSSAIALGDETGMLVSYSGLDVYGSFEIDLNEDGISDIRLGRTTAFFDIVGLTSEAWIEPMHTNCELLIQEIEDTTFMHYTTQYNTNQSNEPIAIQATTYSCSRETPNSGVYKVEKDIILDPKSKGDIITRKDSYQSVRAYFTEADSAFIGQTGFVDQGVVYYALTTYHNGCSDFPGGELKYIGVRLNTPEGVKLGWIRLKVQGSKITINNWAIQSSTAD